LERCSYVTGHNFIGYDLPVLKKVVGWAPPSECTIADTLIAGRVILPNIGDVDRQSLAMGDPSLGTDNKGKSLIGRQSLEAWGARLGIPKIGADIEDWSQWTPEMQARCVGDAKLTKALWQFLNPDRYSQRAIELEHRVAPICERITADGAPFDSAAAVELQGRWTQRYTELEAQLAQQFPGTNLNSRQQIAELLEARGWVPDKRTKKTGRPKIDNETLESVVASYPEFNGLAEYMLLGRRLAALATGHKAWLSHIGADGRIHGGVIHIGTPHSRAKHLDPNLAQVPNPKKGAAYATECRALFRPSNDWVCVAADQSSLQDRGFSHYLHKYDDGAYAQAFLAGEDTHWKTAAALDLVAEGTERNKHNKVHTALREGAKRFRYAFLYGAQAARLGHVIYDTARAAHLIDGGSDLQQRLFGNSEHPDDTKIRKVGGAARQKFLKATLGLKKLLERLQEYAQAHGWLPGLDGRRVPVRAAYTALNYIVTSSEAIICKRWLADVYAELNERFRYGWNGDVVIALWIHDEIVCYCRPDIADQVGEILVRHAKAAGEHYGFRVPLDADYKVGKSWSDEPKTEPKEKLTIDGIVADAPEATTTPPPPQGNGYNTGPHGHTGPKKGKASAQWIYLHPEQGNYLRVEKRLLANGERKFYQNHWNGSAGSMASKAATPRQKFPIASPSCTPRRRLNRYGLLKARRTPIRSSASD
jgi:DNA polymerase-1